MIEARARVALWATLTAGAVLPALVRAEPGIPTYAATYNVEYKGKDLGTSEFSVTYDAKRDIYEFISSTKVKGLLKLVSPNPAVDRSQFKVTGGRIVPLEFWHEDGSRKGEDNSHITFDWERHVALVSNKDGRRELKLQDGTLDRGCIQVALMHDLIVNGKLSGTYLMADDDSVSPYEYADNGETVTPTALGDIPTRAFVQHREKSSRTTTLLMAPSLSYLPARIEQTKDGELQTAFTLESVTGIAGAPAPVGKRKRR